jgi:predicted ribosomally synthesized peptide with SipW-like signal peptide
MPIFASEPRHRARQRPVLASLLASSVAVAVGVVVAITASGGTFALWTSTQTLSAGSVTSGSMTLTVNAATTVALSGTAWSTLLPGDWVQKQVTLKNTGTVAATVSASTTGSFGPLLVHAAKGACSGQLTGTSSTVSPTSFGTFTAGESSLACIQVSLPTSTANGAQGSAQSFTVTFSETAGS